MKLKNQFHGSTRFPQKCGTLETLTQPYGFPYFGKHSKVVSFFSGLPHSQPRCNSLKNLNDNKAVFLNDLWDIRFSSIILLSLIFVNRNFQYSALNLNAHRNTVLFQALNEFLCTLIVFCKTAHLFFPYVYIYSES